MDRHIIHKFFEVLQPPEPLGTKNCLKTQLSQVLPRLSTCVQTSTISRSLLNSVPAAQVCLLPNSTLHLASTLDPISSTFQHNSTKSSSINLTS